MKKNINTKLTFKKETVVDFTPIRMISVTDEQFKAGNTNYYGECTTMTLELIDLKF